MAEHVTSMRALMEALEESSRTVETDDSGYRVTRWATNPEDEEQFQRQVDMYSTSWLGQKLEEYARLPSKDPIGELDYLRKVVEKIPSLDLEGPKFSGELDKLHRLLAKNPKVEYKKITDTLDNSIKLVRAGNTAKNAWNLVNMWVKKANELWGHVFRLGLIALGALGGYYSQDEASLGFALIGALVSWFYVGVFSMGFQDMIDDAEAEADMSSHQFHQDRQAGHEWIRDQLAVYLMKRVDFLVNEVEETSNEWTEEIPTSTNEARMDSRPHVQDIKSLARTLQRIDESDDLEEIGPRDTFDNISSQSDEKDIRAAIDAQIAALKSIDTLELASKVLDENDPEVKRFLTSGEAVNASLQGRSDAYHEVRSEKDFLTDRVSEAMAEFSFNAAAPGFAIGLLGTVVMGIVTLAAPGEGAGPIAAGAGVLTAVTFLAGALSAAIASTLGSMTDRKINALIEQGRVDELVARELDERIANAISLLRKGWRNPKEFMREIEKNRGAQTTTQTEGTMTKKNDSADIRALNESIRDIIKDKDVKQELNESFLYAEPLPYTRVASNRDPLIDEINAIFEGGDCSCDCEGDCDGSCDCDCDKCSKE